MENKNLVPLYGYQRRFLDAAPTLDRMIWRKARQIGVSFIVALAITLDALKNGSTWMVLSASEQQAREVMEDKIQRHVQALQATARYFQYEDIVGGERERIQEAKFSSGGRILSLPANPRTARGFTGNLFLDEFAHHQDPVKIYQAAYPTVSRRGLKLWMASTVFGDSGKFYEIFQNKNKFTKYQTDIYQAAADGCPVDPEEIKADVDPHTWDVEYLCKFVSHLLSFISQELLSISEDPSLPLQSTMAELADYAKEGDLYAGYDVGRKKNKSAFWIVQRKDGRKTTRLLEPLEKQRFSAQKKYLSDYLADLPIRRLCIDATGIGMNLAEDLQEKFGHRVEPVMFTNPAKEHLATRLKEAMEDRLWRMPHDPDVRYDFSSIRQTVTKTGLFRYDAEQNEKGHADFFWAAALANEAATAPTITYEYQSAQKSRKAELRKVQI